jgi:hypothetical protein
LNISKLNNQSITMKKLLLLIAILCCISGLALAQPDPGHREEKIAAFRAEVFTRVLRLTPEEAQGFWPVYNEFQDQREKVQQSARPGKQEDQMTDAEVEEQIKKHFEKKQRELDLERELYQKLRKVLPARKIVRIPAAEREFREALVKRLQENRERKRGR